MIVHPNYRNTSKLIELGQSYLAGLYKEGSPDPVVFSEASTSLINRVEELLMEGPSETELEIEYNSEIDDLHGEIDELHEWIDNMREEIEKAKNHIIDVETERDALIYRANESSEMIETVKGLIIVDTSETETIMAADSKNTGIWLQDNETLGAISAQVKKSIDEDSKAARTSRIDVINAVAEVENTVFKEDVKNFMYDKNMTAAEAEEAITNMFDQAAGILNCVPTSIILQNETGRLQGKVQFDESGNVNFDGVGNSCSDIDGIDGKRYKAIPGDTYVGK
jgi:chromosome segregation ATPase